MFPFTLLWLFSAVVGCGRRSGRGPPAGLRGRSATWGTGAGAKTSSAGNAPPDLMKKFLVRGRRGSALVAWRTRPAIMGAYQNDKQRLNFCLSIDAKEPSGMTSNIGPFRTLAAVVARHAERPQRWDRAGFYDRKSLLKGRSKSVRTMKNRIPSLRDAVAVLNPLAGAKSGVYIVHTLGFGLEGIGLGWRGIPHVSAGSPCFQGLECSSSPTSGTAYPLVRVRGAFALTC